MVSLIFTSVILGRHAIFAGCSVTLVMLLLMILLHLGTLFLTFPRNKKKPRSRGGKTDLK